MKLDFSPLAIKVTFQVLEDPRTDLVLEKLDTLLAGRITEAQVDEQREKLAQERSKLSTAVQTAQLPKE